MSKIIEHIFHEFSGHITGTLLNQNLMQPSGAHVTYIEKF